MSSVAASKQKISNSNRIAYSSFFAPILKSYKLHLLTNLSFFVRIAGGEVPAVPVTA